MHACLCVCASASADDAGTNDIINTWEICLTFPGVNGAYSFSVRSGGVHNAHCTVVWPGRTPAFRGSKGCVNTSEL